LFPVDYRIGYFYHAWKGLTERFWLGTGLNTFRYLSAKNERTPETYSDYAHDHFLQIFAETRVLGGLLFLSLIIFSIYKSVKISSYQEDYGFFLALLGSAVNNIVDYDWQLISLFLYFWVILALIQPKFHIRNKVDLNMGINLTKFLH